MKRECPRARAGRIPPRAPDRETGSYAHGYASDRERARGYDRDHGRAHGCDHARDRAHHRDGGDRGSRPPHGNAGVRGRAKYYPCGCGRRIRADDQDARDRPHGLDCFCVRVCVHPPLFVLSLF